MNTQVDFTKLFSIIDSIVCSLIECADETNTIYLLTTGYYSSQILVKLDTEDNTSIYRYEFTSPREAMEKMEWIIAERGLTVKIVTYFFDGAKTNISSDFYKENDIQYTFSSRCRSSETAIKVNYNLYAPDLDYQELCDNYKYFLELLSQNKRGYGIAEVSPHPNRFLRKSKALSLLLGD